MTNLTQISAILILSTAAFYQPAEATTVQNSRLVIHQHVQEIAATSRELRSSLVDHFRGQRGYGKMLGANAALKGRALAICRRIKRNPNYRRLCRDIEKLDDFRCRLLEAVKEARCKCPSLRNQERLDCQLANISAAVDCIQASVKGPVRLTAAPRPTRRRTGPPVSATYIPEFNPAIDVAPGPGIRSLKPTPSILVPDLQLTPGVIQPVPGALPNVESMQPILDAPSVLERHKM